MLQTFDKETVNRAGFGSVLVLTRKAIASVVHAAGHTLANPSHRISNDRPWVGTAGEIDVEFALGTPIHCIISFKNYGKRPARNVRVFAEVVSHMKTQSAPNFISQINAEQTPITCFPGEEFFVEPHIDLPLVREIDILDIHRGSRRLWVHGRVEYEGDDGHHHTNFRAIYVAHFGMRPDERGTSFS